MDDMVKEVIRIAGGVVPLARMLGISHQTIYKWKRIPLERVFAIEELTNISREHLRPDMFRPRKTHLKPVTGKQLARRAAQAVGRTH